MGAYRAKVNYAYWIAGAMNRTMTYDKAKKIAERFTLKELERIYQVTKGRK